METVCMDDVEIIPTDVIGPDLADLADLSDVIVVPPATTADVLPPISSDLFTYAFQNTATQLVSEGTVYTHSPVTTLSAASDDTSAESIVPSLPASPPVSTASVTSTVQPASTLPSGAFPVSVVSTASKTLSEGIISLPEKNCDDAVFLTPLPIIMYAKPPARTDNNYQRPMPRPSNPNQNQLIKALLAQNTFPAPYMARSAAPKSATQSFIIRASTQHQGKTQILNLPITASTPVSIVRNTTQGGSTRPTFSHSLIVKEMHQRPSVAATRSAFVRTAPGMDFIGRSVTATATTSQPLKTDTTSSITVMTPLTILPQATYTSTASSSHITTTLTNVSTVKPFSFTSTPRTRTNFPTYTKAYIPIPQIAGRAVPKTEAQSTTSDPTSGTVTTTQSPASRVLPTMQATVAPATLTLNTSVSLAAADPASLPSARISPPVVRTNMGPYKSRYLEPGEIPQVRKFPPRTFPGPRSISQRQATTQANTRAQLKAAAHAQHHAEAQAQLKATAHIHQHAASLAVLQATSLAQLQAASHAQLQAASQAQQKATAHAIKHAESQSHQTTTAKSQPNAHLLAEALSQPISIPKTMTAQCATPDRPQTVSLTQTKTDSHGVVQTVHHRLILRSATPVSVTEKLHTAASHASESKVALPKTMSTSESLPDTSVQGSAVSSSPAHTTSTLTLSTGTTLIMPHYKTTVFKNLSTIARSEAGARAAAPATSAATAPTERVVIRRPVAYFSARRTFPTPPAGHGATTTVNVQRHIIRTIPRHVLGTHLQDLSRASAASAHSSVCSTPLVVSTSTSVQPSLHTSISVPQSDDKKNK